MLKSEVEEYLDYDYDEYLLSLNTRNASSKKQSNHHMEI